MQKTPISNKKEEYTSAKQNSEYNRKSNKVIQTQTQNPERGFKNS